MFSPEENFVILSMSRSAMADMLNDIIEDTEVEGITPFEPGDKRLTAAFCGEVAELLEELHEDDLDEEEFVDARRLALRNKMVSELGPK